MKRYATLILSLILTASLGRIQSGDHIETWYDLPMERVIQNAQAAGICAEYWIRDDGAKMFGPWVIVAAHPSITRYSIVQTSLGEGIVLDRHATGEPELYDIATDWKVKQ